MEINHLLTTRIITTVSVSSSVATIVGLSKDKKPLGLSLASIVTVALAKPPTLAPPVASDRLTVNPYRDDDQYTLKTIVLIIGLGYIPQQFQG